MLRALPMEIVGPVLGICTILATIVAGVVTVRVLPARLLRNQPRSGALDPGERQALDEATARLGELDQLQQRIAELEERVDFTERLLAQHREEPRLPPPQGG